VYRRGTVIKPKTKALAVAGAAGDKKALDIVLIKMRKMSSVCDYFVIASGTSTTQVGAIADHIRARLSQKGERLWHIEGAREASWILLDFGDVVAHVFLDQTRRFYDLERLWCDAPQERFEEEKKPAKRRKRHIPAKKKLPKKKLPKKKKTRK